MPRLGDDGELPPLQDLFGLGFVVDDLNALTAAAFVKFEENRPTSVKSVCRHGLTVGYRIQRSWNNRDLDPLILPERSDVMNTRVVLIIFLATPCLSLAADIYVPDDYSTIQGAIDRLVLESW